VCVLQIMWVGWIEVMRIERLDHRLNLRMKTGSWPSRVCPSPTGGSGC
jgi:hypothetical protein